MIIEHFQRGHLLVSIWKNSKKTKKLPGVFHCTRIKCIHVRKTFYEFKWSYPREIKVHDSSDRTSYLRNRDSKVSSARKLRPSSLWREAKPPPDLLFLISLHQTIQWTVNLLCFYLIHKINGIWSRMAVASFRVLLKICFMRWYTLHTNDIGLTYRTDRWT